MRMVVQKSAESLVLAHTERVREGETRLFSSFLFFPVVQMLCSLGVDRVLTSGRCNTAVEGVATLKALQRTFGHQIGVICAGWQARAEPRGERERDLDAVPSACPGGVNASNVKYLVETSGVQQVHASCRAGIRGAMQFGTECQIGPTLETVQWLFRNGNIYCTDKTKVAELVTAVSRQVRV